MEQKLIFAIKRALSELRFYDARNYAGTLYELYLGMGYMQHAFAINRMLQLASW